MSRVVVFRLVGGSYEGQWVEVYPLSRFDGQTVYKIEVVATGSVEWDGDRCAEVYVPEDKLDLWKAEHDVQLADGSDA